MIYRVVKDDQSLQADRRLGKEHSIQQRQCVRARVRYLEKEALYRQKSESRPQVKLNFKGGLFYHFCLSKASFLRYRTRARTHCLC